MLRAMKITGNLLLIDDDADLLQLLDVTLTRLGHRVTTASSWDEVVSRLNETAGANKSYDIIFLDLMMPVRTGFDVLRSLKVLLYPLPPVVVLTALSGIEHAVQALELGATKYLTKPVARDKLAETVREILQGKQKSRF
jgi:two-component system response regulator PilR (NtrC family)